MRERERDELGLSDSAFVLTEAFCGCEGRGRGERKGERKAISSACEEGYTTKDLKVHFGGGDKYVHVTICTNVL